MTIYLYIKTHRKTGLKYLGMTTRDPYKYRGSGDHWKKHIRKHGYDVETIILRECHSREELRTWGIHYSNLWNIVGSDEWANLKEESGEGTSSESMKRKWKDLEFREKMDKKYSDPTYKNLQREKAIAQWKSADFRIIRIESARNQAKKQWEDPEYRMKMCESQSTKMKSRWDDAEYRDRMNGKTHPAYKHNLHHFIHSNGLEEICTAHDLYTKYCLDKRGISKLVHNKCKSYKGWRLFNGLLSSDG